MTRFTIPPSKRLQAPKRPRPRKPAFPEQREARVPTVLSRSKPRK